MPPNMRFLYLVAMLGRDIKLFSGDELRREFSILGIPAFRADQVLHWLLKRRACSFDEMDNLPKALRENLDQHFVARSLEEHALQVSEDGTHKWALRTRDGYLLETVLIPTQNRNSLCISTQIGCAMGCRFCSTAQMGFHRNLETGEILEQVLFAQDFIKKENPEAELSNVIFMGMGEPLNNFANVDRACRSLHDNKFFAMGRRRITVSTSGIVPKILAMAEQGTPANLAISLNGTNDIMRSSVMPIAERYPMEELLSAVDDYLAKTGWGVTFEYILIKDLTCTPAAAKELLKWTSPRNCMVNAIVINESDDPALEPPSPEDIDEFLETVRRAGTYIIVRTPRGCDIKAACGQLAIHEQKVA